MPGPVSDFLATMMQLTQMQQAAQGLQIERENAEVQRFASLSGIATTITDPTARRSFAESVEHLVPPGGVDILANAPPSLQAITAATTAKGLQPGADSFSQETAAAQLTGRTQGELADSSLWGMQDVTTRLLALRTQRGLELSAGEQQQGAQFNQQMTLNREAFVREGQEWQAEFAERLRANRVGEGFQARQLAQGDVSLGLEARRVDLQAVGLEQQHEATMLGAVSGTPGLPMLLSSTLRGEAATLQRTLDTQGASMSPEARAQAQQELADLRSTITGFDSWAESMKKSGTDVEGMTLNQLISARTEAFQDIQEAKSTAAKQEAEKAYNYISMLLRAAGGPPATGLQTTTSPWDILPFNGPSQRRVDLEAPAQ